MTLVRFARAANAVFGPLEFFRHVKRIFAENPRMDWQSWDELFALGEELLLVRRSESVMAYPELARALTRTWKSAHEARSRGETCWQWQMHEGYRLDALIGHQHKLEENSRLARLESAKRNTRRATA